MSVLTPKRLYLCVVALLIGTTAFASHPSPRTLARMVYDPNTNLAVLFGGQGYRDGATGLTHNSSETWLWTGAAWVQRFPATTPPARAAHSMTYDPVHRRVLMFGGRQEPTQVSGSVSYLDDLWAWQGDNWVRLDADSATRPSARQSAGIAYDPQRDRLVIYGGIQTLLDEEDLSL
ncbi:MAG TPA: kelch repeat-containing protein, partial [Thermoanaerobaculia bacterium]